MKTKILFFYVMATLPLALNAQDKRDFSYFNNVKISYVVSSMAQGFDHFKKDQSLIPYGVGIETSLVSFKRFSLDCGFQARTTGNKAFDGIMISEFGYSGPFYMGTYQLYYDIPVHFTYDVFRRRFFEISILAGTRTTYQKSRYFSVTDKEDTLLFESWNTGYEVGLTETLKLFRGLNVYASQSRNKYMGEKSFLRTIDLDFGLIFNFN